MPPAHACNACKRRKVKCDGIEPCSNCRLSHLRCCYDGVLGKRSRGVQPLLGESAPTVANPSSHRSISTDTSPPSESHVRYLHSAASGIPPTNHLQEGLSDGQQHSPQSLLTPSSIVLSHTGSGESTLGSSFYYDAGRVHSTLLAGVGALLAPQTIFDLAHECIDFFVQYLFPNTPIAHEPTLRSAATLLTPDSLVAFTDLSSSSHDTYQQISCLRRFSLVTALCAFVISVSPERIPTQRPLLSVPFLSASKAMLRVYEEYDLEHPDSTSLTIRMWHSAAMQNTTGRVGTSYQYHAEAGFLAQRLRLYNERSVEQHSKIESQLLRASFWLLFLADKTSIALETRPPVLNEAAFDDDFTLLENNDGDEPLLDAGRKVNQGNLESRIFLGFYLKRRIWTAAADLLVSIRLFARRKRHNTIQSIDKDAELTRLAESYLLFTSLTDELPGWLRNPDGSITSDDEEVISYQKNCFWTQRSNIMTVFHCMKLVILQKCIENDMHVIVGLNEHTMSWAMRKIEIVRDFLHELQVVPFSCFKVQGETAVERIRRVGTILLELVDNAENDTIKRVARSQFENLLDLLAQLDSKASDELAGGSV